ncbi:hypothetical protein TTHERM_01001290 (macronuclear) [Tetrahymena thermophila SB210]|uniref:Uncharacterized protein n=1 Tax=Tetrahymena thermophila (strain SB210) TaxID=312017 RepID=Q24HJ4_TETTS|nr:hypothetical protein TTHERM_01001290 [Tetrahymena thermophila SB210]EAS07237.2 hypothetical protein TTHERM_01001290 [Tetrahymena thermophila SB210]|eukprot:XP_001027479.2 hypothetical protein TTHERM_01001290 [Tetrahymena thermophila SB210]
MEIEDQRQQRLSLIEKYDYYTYHEFSLKPALLTHYIQLLKEEREYDKIDQIFLCYLHQFNQFYLREDSIYKQQQQQSQQNVLSDYSFQNNDQNTHNTFNSLKLVPLVEKQKKLKRLLHFLVIISYQHTLNIRKYLENEKIRDFDELYFDSLILYAKSKNDQAREKQILCQKLVYFIHFNLEGQLSSHKTTQEENNEENVSQLSNIIQNESQVLSKQGILESLYAICYYYFVQENYEQAEYYVNKIELQLLDQDTNEAMQEEEQVSYNHEITSFFKKDIYEGIKDICQQVKQENVLKKQQMEQEDNISDEQIQQPQDILEEGDDEGAKQGKSSLQKIRQKLSQQESGIINNDDLQQETEADIEIHSRKESFQEEAGEFIRNSRKNSICKIMSQDIEEQNNLQYSRLRSQNEEEYRLIEQDFYNSFTALVENEQVKIADSLLQQNLNHQNNIDLKNQKEFHELLYREFSSDTNLSLNLITIQIQTEGSQQNTIENYILQCEDIIKQKGIPIPSSIFAFFMTLAKVQKFEDNIQYVILSIENILKNYCSQNQLNLGVIYDNLSKPEGYERNEKKEGIAGLKNYQEIYSVYTLIMLKNIFYLRLAAIYKKNQKDTSQLSLNFEQPKNDDILKNVFMLWNILYQFNLTKKSQIAQFIQITNNYTCLQLIKAVIFTYWTRYFLEKAFHTQNKKRLTNSPSHQIYKYQFNLNQIGQILAQEEVYLQTEYDFFNYTSTFSLKFEDFEEYLMINSLAPQFSVKNFEEEAFEFLLSQIFKQEKKMLKQYNSEQTSSNNNKGVDLEDQTLENKLLFLGKKEQNQYKSYKKYALEKIRYYYLSGNFSKSLRMLISLMNQNFLQKYKNQEIFTKESINSMLATSLYHQKCYVECLICLQFSDKVNYQHIQKVLDKISYFNYSYVPLLINITLIKQLVIKFNKDSVLTKKLVERIESPECNQNYSDGKHHKIKTLLKIKFLKNLKDKQFEIQQMQVISSSLQSVSLSSYQPAKQL